eukprot:TRINITY_DN39893_c0_g2_i2.p2 TRINITY_DN39893_c0_g2~~TRINITY_DN39893_c0_g2_i2.p2  ORF type:complete len:703 (-),score=204.22 TRINITY_DN39893_c0_g2_i2:2489-4597(-)
MGFSLNVFLRWMEETINEVLPNVLSLSHESSSTPSHPYTFFYEGRIVIESALHQMGEWEKTLQRDKQEQLIEADLFLCVNRCIGHLRAVMGFLMGVNYFHTDETHLVESTLKGRMCLGWMESGELADVRFRKIIQRSNFIIGFLWFRRNDMENAILHLRRSRNDFEVLQSHDPDILVRTFSCQDPPASIQSLKKIIRKSHMEEDLLDCIQENVVNDSLACATYQFTLLRLGRALEFEESTIEEAATVFERFLELPTHANADSREIMWLQYALRLVDIRIEMGDSQSAERWCKRAFERFEFVHQSFSLETEDEEVRELDGRLHLSCGAIETMRLKELSSKGETMSLKCVEEIVDNGVKMLHIAGEKLPLYGFVSLHMRVVDDVDDLLQQACALPFTIERRRQFFSIREGYVSPMVDELNPTIYGSQRRSYVLRLGVIWSERFLMECDARELCDEEISELGKRAQRILFPLMESVRDEVDDEGEHSNLAERVFLTSTIHFSRVCLRLADLCSETSDSIDHLNRGLEHIRQLLKHFYHQKENARQYLEEINLLETLSVLAEGRVRRLGEAGMERVDRFRQLHESHCCRVLRCLSVEEILEMSKVDGRFYWICQSDQIWSEIYQRVVRGKSSHWCDKHEDEMEEEDPRSLGYSNFKDAVIQHYRLHGIYRQHDGEVKSLQKQLDSERKRQMEQIQKQIEEKRRRAR